MRSTISIIIFFILVTIAIVYSLKYLSSSGVPEPHSLKYDDQSFSKIANDIINQNEIFEMDDGSSPSSLLNDVPIKMTEDSNSEDSFFHEVFYKKALDSLHINPTRFENLKSQLSSTGLHSFYKSGDSILFIVDRFRDDGWGYLYVAGSNRYTTKSSVLNSHLSIVDSINAKWKKVGVY